mmetsp:Transcript_22568/g.61075  ORF Transcript_22568/g.61075 Transcript_22568/m.61075 type:complete len:284 (+) Transcript_22568:163-1014(+)
MRWWWTWERGTGEWQQTSRPCSRTVRSSSRATPCRSTSTLSRGMGGLSSQRTMTSSRRGTWCAPHPPSLSRCKQILASCLRPRRLRRSSMSPGRSGTMWLLPLSPTVNRSPTMWSWLWSVRVLAMHDAFVLRIAHVGADGCGRHATPTAPLIVRCTRCGARHLLGQSTWPNRQAIGYGAHHLDSGPGRGSALPHAACRSRAPGSRADSRPPPRAVRGPGPRPWRTRPALVGGETVRRQVAGRGRAGRTGSPHRRRPGFGVDVLSPLVLEDLRVHRRQGNTSNF